MSLKTQWRRQDRRTWRGKRFSVFKPLSPGEVAARSVSCYRSGSLWAFGQMVAGQVGPVVPQ